MKLLDSNQKPFRKVTGIKESRGAKNGLSYFLTLDCGHITIRRAQKVWQPLAGHCYKEAPQKARCDVCAYEDQK